ncbi:MAG TPA: LysR family transcriptional regulator [Burkholderiaceae bacterium]|jgi:DNA-binding transcriptional LysR family regulator|nr:LysR family transcriptional regulator [Burkholderiaceae bacterium]
MNPKNLDLYVLRCLHALIAEAHVTRAAERMGMGQPAMSAMLARLRTLFGDPLLVRTEKGMVPTARALEVSTQVQQALELIDRAVSEGAPFDATQANTHFHLAASESVSFVLIPALMAHLRKCAPTVNITVHVPNLPRVRQELEEGEVDLVVGYLRGAADGLHSSPLVNQRLSVIVAGTHPTIQGSITLDQYVQYPHACYRLSRSSTSTIENQVEEALAKVGRRRSIAISLPSAVASPAVVATSDLIATIPERVARHFAPQFGLQVLRPPLPLDDVAIAMYWHGRMQNNAAHQWLRQMIRDLAALLQASG